MIPSAMLYRQSRSVTVAPLRSKTTFAASVLTILLGAFAYAHSAVGEEKAELSLELNSLEQAERGCKLSLVVTNLTGSHIDAARLEIALFNKQQKLVRLVSLRPGRLPKTKKRVKQFELTAIKCASLGSILLNDIPECKGAELTPRACLELAKPTSRTDVPFQY